MQRVAGLVVLVCGLVLAAGCQSVTGVVPEEMTLNGYQPVEVKGAGFSGLMEGNIEVRFGGVKAVNVHLVDDTTITAVPQGSATPGVVDVSVKDTRLLGTVVSKPAAFTWLDTPNPEYRNVVNFGPSLSAGVTNMGYAPPGQINSIPGFIARELGLYFPQRIVIEGGIPPIESPHETDLLFVGDGVRECFIPASGRRYVPAPGELCNPVIVSLDSIPILDLVGQLIDDILLGILQGKGLVGGLFQDGEIENRNWAIPGEQMHGFVYGTKLGFSYLQDFFNDPMATLRNPFCSGEPVVKMIADMSPPADLVIGYDWFFDSVLFSPPPLNDLIHQLAYTMLVLSNSQYYQGTPCPAGTNDGAWRVPLISTDGTLTRTYQPYEGMFESCDPTLQCPGAADTVGITSAEKLKEVMASLGDKKEGYVPDWIGLGLIPASADTNGNGVIDILPLDPAHNEFTAPVIANIVAADDPSDNPKAVLLGTMPWPSASSSGQGGEPGGGDDQFAEAIDANLMALYDLFQQAFAIAGRPNNLVMVDSLTNQRLIFEGNQPDLTHGLDGDYATQDLFYEYELGPGGEPLKRRFTQYGGVFSMDHLHLSQTMNGATVVGLTDAMNATLGTSIPRLDLPSVWQNDPYNHTKYDPSIQCAYTGRGCPAP